MLYIFNPSTEIALAKNSASFTPTRAVADFERRLSLLPSLYAPAGSTILLPPSLSAQEVEGLPYYSIAMEQRHSLVTLNEVRGLDTGVMPWGWNMPLVNQLLHAGIKSESLPSQTALNSIRTLAHRRTTATVWSGIASYFHSYSTNTRQCELLSKRAPGCFTSIDIAINYLKDTPGDYVLKAPWSSSGRGILFTRGATSQQIARRITDTIRAHGAIMIEPHWENICDFATEWNYVKGKVRFLGYSLFSTDASGRYLGNRIAPQEILHSEISRHVDRSLLHESITALETTLNAILSPLSGVQSPVPFGIDMLVDSQGNLNPCVELNLRYTMGHVALRLHELTGKEFLFIPGEELPVPLKFTTFAS